MLEWPADGERKVGIVVSGDKGGKAHACSVKIGFQIVNLARPNSPANFTLCAMFTGQDSRANIEEKAAPIFKQLKEIIAEQNQLIRLDGGEEELVEFDW